MTPYRVGGRPSACTSLVALFLVTLSAITSAQSERTDTLLSTAEIARRVTPSVVTISTPTGHGSGVIVDASGVLVTNLHVVRGNATASVTLSNGDIYDDIAVVDFDERRDLLLLKIKAFNVTPATLGNSDDVEVGEDVVLVGTPQDPALDSTVSAGVISAIRDTGAGYRMLQTSAPASPGSSGSGMFNAYGELIGIVTSQHPEGQNLNFAIPVNYLRGILSVEPTMTLVELVEVTGGARSTADGNLDPNDSESNSGISDADNATFIELIGSLANDENMRELLDIEDVGDGYWIATYKAADYFDGIRTGMSLITDDLDQSIVWVRATWDPDRDLTASHTIQLLRMNYDLNIAKVALDNDGDVSTMAELELRTLDTFGLLRAVYAVSEALDDVAEILASSEAADTGRLTAPPPPASSEIAGRWTGSGRASTALWQGGGCHGESLRTSDIPIQDIMIWHLNQSGPQITGSIAFSRQIGTLDPFTFNSGFSGTIVGSELRGTVGSGNTQNFTVRECGSERWTIEWEPMVFTGTVLGTRIELSVSERGVVYGNTGSHDISSSWQVTLEK